MALPTVPLRSTRLNRLLKPVSNIKLQGKVITMQTLKKAAVNTALAGVTMLAGTGAYGCAKDETPPVIQSYQDVNPPIIQNFQIPEYSVEGENVAFI